MRIAESGLASTRLSATAEPPQKKSSPQYVRVSNAGYGAGVGWSDKQQRGAGLRSRVYFHLVQTQTVRRRTSTGFSSSFTDPITVQLLLLGRADEVIE
jgi:hypothetical protein